MSELIKLHSHGNSISVIALRRHRIFRKVAHSRNAKTLLKNELSGLKWYESQRKNFPSMSQVSLFKLNENILDIPILEGQQVSYEAPLKSTINFVLRALEHYALIWPPGKKGAVHGDLTMDNIFFSEQGVFFFDWEHFSEEGEVWGFDAVYLVLSSILLNDFKKNVKLGEQKLILKVWRKLAEIGVSLSFLASPLSTIIGILTTDPKWSIIITNSPSKLFPLLLSPKQVADMDQIFENITVNIT